MKGFDMMTRALGVPPEFMQQAQQFLEGMGSTFRAMEQRQIEVDNKLDRLLASNLRIESNTILLLEGMDGTVPAAPTNYEAMPALDKLPPLTNEVVTHERSE